MDKDGNDKHHNTDVCPAHSGVIANVDSLGRSIDQLRDGVSDLTNKLDEFVKRPTWLICIVISTMGGIIGVLATFILYAHFANKV